MNDGESPRRHAREPRRSGDRRLVELARGAGWLLVIAAGLRVIDVVLGKSALAVSLLGAVFVDIATSRAGVTWDETRERGPDAHRRLAARIGVGIASVAAVVALALVASVVTGQARVGLGKPSPVIAFDALRASALGVRDELLLRGVPLMTAKRARVPLPCAIAFSALTGVAAIGLAEGTALAALVLAGASGLLFTALWVRFKSAWPTVAAHAAWLLLTGSLLRGGLLDVTWQHGMLTAGSRASGPEAWIGAAAFTIAAAFILSSRRESPR